MEEPRATDVAGPTADAGSPSPAPRALFEAWRRLVGTVARVALHVARGAGSSARAWAAQWRQVRDYHRVSAQPWQAEAHATRDVAAAVGLRAFVFGLIVTGIITVASRGLWLPAGITVASEVLWAAVRFIIIALLMPRGAVDRTRLSVAYMAGLLPYAVGATWLLRVIALLASAVLTRRGLLGAGVPARDSRLAVGWAFGGQAGIIAGSWLVRALIALAAGG